MKAGLEEVTHNQQQQKRTRAASWVKSFLNSLTVHVIPIISQSLSLSRKYMELSVTMKYEKTKLRFKITSKDTKYNFYFIIHQPRLKCMQALLERLKNIIN